jgi:ribosomal protein RSM22 (predicted rRNA methylase)
MGKLEVDGVWGLSSQEVPTKVIYPLGHCRNCPLLVENGILWCSYYKRRIDNEEDCTFCKISKVLVYEEK